MSTKRFLALLLVSITSYACPTPLDNTPSSFSGPVTPMKVYAVDPAGLLPAFLIYDVDSKNTDVGAKPPAIFNRYRVEFNQPLKGSTVSGDLDILNSTANLTYTFCSPAGGNAVQFIDVDDGNRVIPASTCYDPSSGTGGNPNVLVIPGTGTLTAGSTAKPLTCQAFTAAATAETLIVAHQYKISFANTIKGAGGGALTAPASGGWDTNGNFTFKTEDFKVLAHGFQNQVTGYFYWTEKLPGFETGVPATPPGNQIDCDFGSTNATQQPCRIPPDDTAYWVVGTAPFNGSTAANVTIKRANGTDVEGGAAAVQSSRIVAVNTGNRWEPNQTYKLTVPTTVTSSSATGSRPLPAQLDVNFQAGSGLVSGSTTGVVNVVTVVPDPGSSANPITTDSATIVYSYPADISGSGVTLTVTGGGKTVSGTAVVEAGTDKQVVTIPITQTLDSATTYTVTATGVKVATGIDAPGVTPGATFPSSVTTFRTQEFNVAALVSADGSSQWDGSSTVPPETLVNGDLVAAFVSPVNTSTVTTSSITVNEAGTKVATYTVTPAADSAVIKVTDANFVAKFNTSYTVVASTSIKDSTGTKSVTAEGCTAGDCTQTLGFRTLPFRPTSAITRATGVLTITFPYAIDPSQISDFLGTGTNQMFGIYPETLSVDSVTGAHVRTADLTQLIPVNCAINGANTVITCTPSNPSQLKPSTYYVARAVFYETKQAGVGGPAVVASPQTIGGQSVKFDTATGRFFGLVPGTTVPTREFITPCPP